MPVARSQTVGGQASESARGDRVTDQRAALEQTAVGRSSLIARAASPLARRLASAALRDAFTSRGDLRSIRRVRPFVIQAFWVADPGLCRDA
jgi:hypothetical protein